jgi:hypothetical protein
MRRLIVGILVLALLLAGGDLLLRAIASRRIGDQVAMSMGLGESPSVSLGGFPFVIRFMGGSLPSASLAATDVRRSGVTFRRLRLDLVDVRFEPLPLLSGRATTIRARSGTGSLRLDARGLNEALPDLPASAVVVLRQNAVAVRSEQFGTVPAHVSVSEGRILVTVEGLGTPVSVEIDLPAVVRDMEFTHVRIEDRQVVVSFRLDSPSLDLA